jgi:hypothetical protein
MSAAGTIRISYKSVAVLRPGCFTALNGPTIELRSADLAGLAQRYNPQYYCAPLKLGHSDTGPALGRIERLQYDGAYLRADLAAVPEELAAAIDAGRYPGRSVELYLDLDGRGQYLRALALLGVQPPAVKGLPPFPARWQQGGYGEDWAGLCAAPRLESVSRSSTSLSTVMMSSYINR